MANTFSPAEFVKTRPLPPVEFDFVESAPKGQRLSPTDTPVRVIQTPEFDFSRAAFIVQHGGRKSEFRTSDEFMSALELVLDLGIGCQVSIAREAQVDFERVNSLLRKHKMAELSRNDNAAEGWDIQFELRPLAA